MLEGVVTTVSKVAALGEPKKRTAAVNERLKAPADPKTSEGKQTLQWRAEFITALRRGEVWP